jgi:hypothetical protein
MNRDDFFNLIIGNISNDVFSIKSENLFEITESGNGCDYSIEVRQKKKNVTLIIKPQTMKSKTSYLVRNVPKDCDYIFISIDDEVILYIEMKHSSTTSSSKTISEQLDSGEKWLRHLLFLLKCEDNFEHFERVKLCCRYNNRMDRKLKLEKNMFNVINYNGRLLDLREVIKVVKT